MFLYIYIYISLLAVSFIYVFLLRAASAVPRARIAGAKKACLAKAATHVRTANCAFIYIYIDIHSNLKVHMAYMIIYRLICHNGRPLTDG